MILTAAQLRSFYNTSQVFVADQDYASPTSVWLQRIFYPWFWEYRTDLGLRAYSRRNDCDNFARACAQSAQDCHALTGDGKASGEQAEGISIGECWYRRLDGSQHAINTGIFDGTERRFFEPQSGQFLDLAPEEIASISFIRF